MRWLLLAAAGLLFWWTWFVFGFLAEPSVVGNLRVGLIVVIASSLALSLASALAGFWLLLGRRPRVSPDPSASGTTSPGR